MVDSLKTISCLVFDYDDDVVVVDDDHDDVVVVAVVGRKKHYSGRNFRMAVVCFRHCFDQLHIPLDGTLLESSLL